MSSESLAKFRALVKQRGEYLRQLPLEELTRFATRPTEHLNVESRPATIDIIVQSLPEGGIRVVIQGFVKTWIGKDVALDGFYKYSDETCAPMPDEELLEFD
jgi:hypothetical protein